MQKAITIIINDFSDYIVVLIEKPIRQVHIITNTINE